MKTHCLFTIAVFLCFSPGHARAQSSEGFELEKIVVGSKREASSSEYTGNVDILTELGASGSEKVLDELESLPGVSVARSGPQGQQASIFIWGSEAGQVLVVVDGVRVNDPSSPGKTFNSALLNVGDIEKIEVLKGPQSLLYGSDAIGGVVNIVTKKGASQNWLGVHYGYSRGVHLDHSLLAGSTLLYAHLYYEKAEGISAASSGTEKDGYENKGANLSLSRSFGNGLEGEWVYKVVDGFVETDTVDFSSGEPVDASDNYSDSVQQIFSQKLEKRRGSSVYSYLFGANKMDRSNKGSGITTKASGFETSHELHWRVERERSSYLLGLEYIGEEFEIDNKNKRSAGLGSAFFIGEGRRDVWFWQYGARYGEHSEFGGALTPSVGAGARLGEYRWAINYQQGFKSPTLTQLYSPSFPGFEGGNPNLDPERSEHADLSFEYRDSFKATLFYHRTSDAILFLNDLGGYRNSRWMEVGGVEASARFKSSFGTWSPGIYLADHRAADGSKAWRRPAQKFTLRYENAWSSNDKFVADYVLMGKRWDLAGTQEKTLRPYGRLDLHYERRMANVLLALGAENALGESYEEVYGQSSQPFTLYAKARYYY